MPGARPSSFKKGGGFLNNVAGTISGYEFTTEIPGAKKAAGKKKSDFTSLFFALSVRQDGADEDVTTHLWSGSADDFEISEDGLTITPLEDGAGLRDGTALAVFLRSLVDAGFPESSLPDDAINFEPIIGTRAQFKQQVNEEATKRLGKRKDAKTGKEYSRNDLIVENVLELPNAKGKAAGKGAKPAPAAVKGAKGAKGKAATVDYSEAAGEALVRYLEGADGELPFGKIRMKVLTDATFKGDPDLKEGVQKWLGVKANLDEVEGVKVKDDTVSLG